MSISDELMWRYWLLLSDRSEADLAAERRRVAEGALHPMEVKKELAGLLVGELHSPAAAAAARAEFERVFGGGQLPEEIEEENREVPVGERPLIARELVEIGFAASNSEARRLIQQGGVKVDGETVTDINADLGGAVISGNPVLVQVGKRRFKRLRYHGT
jgi:tyrosyl-tRNA synthetase